MAKYLLTNWETVPFKKKSFDGQLDRYLKVCVASFENPQQILFIIPLFGTKNGGGFADLIEVVRNHELGRDEQSHFSFKELLTPQEGELVDVPSKHGPLFRVFTKDDARYNMCSINDIGRAERTATGKVKIYNSIRVFTLLHVDNETGEKVVLDGWRPDDLYNRLFRYNYRVLSDLTEPLQLK